MEAGLGKGEPGLDGAHSIRVAGAQDLHTQRADAAQLQPLALHTLLHLLLVVGKAISTSLWGQAPTPERVKAEGSGMRFFKRRAAGSSHPLPDLKLALALSHGHCLLL